MTNADRRWAGGASRARCALQGWGATAGAWPRKASEKGPVALTTARPGW
jgi:hypothetical protein